MEGGGNSALLFINNKMNFEIKEITSLSNYQIIVDLWNKEYEFVYPLTTGLVNKNLSNMNSNASFIAVVDNEVVGFIIGKTSNSYINSYIANYADNAWISLIYVCPKYRKNGIGSALIEAVTKIFKKLNCKIIYVGRDLYNFFPGIPEDLKQFQKFFIDHGFTIGGLTHDLISRTYTKLDITNNQYTFRTGTLEDKENILKFLYETFPGRWYFEGVEYFKEGGSGKEYMLCLNENNEVIAFAKIGLFDSSEVHSSYSMNFKARFNKLGGIGPLGVAHAYRGKGLGKDIVVAAKNMLIDYSSSDFIIDWTGLLEFYRKMGFEVWKVYSYTYKELGKENI